MLGDGGGSRLSGAPGCSFDTPAVRRALAACAALAAEAWCQSALRKEMRRQRAGNSSQVVEPASAGAVDGAALEASLARAVCRAAWADAPLATALAEAVADGSARAAWGAGGPAACQALLGGGCAGGVLGALYGAADVSAAAGRSYAPADDATRGAQAALAAAAGTGRGVPAGAHGGGAAAATLAAAAAALVAARGHPALAALVAVVRAEAAAAVAAVEERAQAPLLGPPDALSPAAGAPRTTQGPASRSGGGGLGGGGGDRAVFAVPAGTQWLDAVGWCLSNLAACAAARAWQRYAGSLSGSASRVWHATRQQLAGRPPPPPAAVEALAPRPRNRPRTPGPRLAWPRSSPLLPCGPVRGGGFELHQFGRLGVLRLLVGPPRHQRAPQDLSIWDLASHFGFTGRPKFPTKRSKRLQHSPCPCGRMFLNIAG